MKKDMNLSSIMKQMWMFVKMYGMSKSEALRQAWKNFKLRQAMKKKVVKFWYMKIDGTLRQAYGHLIESMLPSTKGTGAYKPNPTTQCYFDTEVNSYRSFKIANLIRFESV